MLHLALMVLSLALAPESSQQTPNLKEHNEQASKAHTQATAGKNVTQSAPVTSEKDTNAKVVECAADRTQNGETQERIAEYALWQMRAGWVMVAVALLTGFVVWRYTSHAKRQAEAMLASVSVAQQQLDAADRPWIKVDAEVAGDLTFSQAGAEFRLKLILTNIGRSAAMRVNYQARVLLLGFMTGVREQTTAAQERAAKEAIVQVDADETLGTSLFPEEYIRVKPDQETVSREEVVAKTVPVLDFSRPVLVGCVIYRGTHSEKDYWTKFAFNIDGPPTHEAGWVEPVHPGKDLTASSITLRKAWTSGAT
ncbi:MAG: hypothetical protein ACHQQS_17140 [Thermoanaerobaculales bacterium]